MNTLAPGDMSDFLMSRKQQVSSIADYYGIHPEAIPLAAYNEANYNPRGGGMAVHSQQNLNLFQFFQPLNPLPTSQVPYSFGHKSPVVTPATKPTGQ
jgi:hypothetical protein